MKILFLMLFYSKTILLTISPITINNEWLDIHPKETFTAITGGASIMIDITDLLPSDKDISITDSDFIYKLFPQNSIHGELLTSTNEVIRIQYKKGISYGNTNIRLILRPEKSMPTDKTFTKLRLKSKQEMKLVKIYWKNFSL